MNKIISLKVVGDYVSHGTCGWYAGEPLAHALEIIASSGGSERYLADYRGRNVQLLQEAVVKVGRKKVLQVTVLGEWLIDDLHRDHPTASVCSSHCRT